MKEPKHLLHKHPMFTRAEDIVSLCSPLHTLGIQHFSHVQVTKDGKFSILSKNPDFLQNYMQSALYHFDIFQLTPDNQEQYYLRDVQNLTGKTRQLQDLFNQHGFGHSFSISRRSKDQIDFYNFGAALGNQAINEVYFQKLDQLKQFISYFHYTVGTDKKLATAYEYQLPLKSADSGFQLISDSPGASFELGSSSRIYVPDKNTYLTLREYECLSWLAKGKTHEQIALILNISERTVRAHTVSVKEKLQCVNQFQLGVYFSKLSL